MFPLSVYRSPLSCTLIFVAYCSKPDSNVVSQRSAISILTVFNTCATKYNPHLLSLRMLCGVTAMVQQLHILHCFVISILFLASLTATKPSRSGIWFQITNVISFNRYSQSTQLSLNTQTDIFCLSIISQTRFKNWSQLSSHLNSSIVSNPQQISMMTMV